MIKSDGSLTVSQANKPIGCCSTGEARRAKGKRRRIFMSETPECRAAERATHRKVKAAAVPSPPRQPRPPVVGGNLIFPSKMTMMENAANPCYAFRTEYFPVAPIDRYCYLPSGSVR